MSVLKIVYAVGLLLAVVAAFVNVPYAPVILALCGVVASFAVLPEHHVRVIVTALALHFLGNTLDGVPAVGGHVSTILANLGTLVAGASLQIIVRNIIMRLKNWA
ncbi:MAG: hypothetical protein KGL25_04080 [Gammaproteobacteria bacterium]|nr:hypothetical protein [Gammaproteobacteria bacterium]MDE2250567.1 hypothetical protein [Gammaproteobacteria bacterium]